MMGAEQRNVYLAMTLSEARAAHHALGTFVELYDQVEAHDGVPAHAPMYGKRDTIADLARRLDHETNHAPSGTIAPALLAAAVELDRAVERALRRGVRPAHLTDLLDSIPGPRATEGAPGARPLPRTGASAPPSASDGGEDAPHCRCGGTFRRGDEPSYWVCPRCGDDRDDPPITATDIIEDLEREVAALEARLAPASDGEGLRWAKRHCADHLRAEAAGESVDPGEAREAAIALDRNWTDDDGEPLGGWVEVDGDEWNTIVAEVGGVRALQVFSSLTDPEGQFGSPQIYTAWGHRDAAHPLVDIRDYKENGVTSESILRKFVPTPGEGARS